MTMEELRAMLESGGHESLACHNPEMLDKLFAVAEAAKLVHQYDDSPLPNAQLLYDDAMFCLGTALAALEAP